MRSDGERNRMRRSREADGRAEVGAVTVYLLDLRGRQRPRPDGHREDVALEMVRPVGFAEDVLRSREHARLEAVVDVRREHAVLVEARRRRRQARRKHDVGHVKGIGVDEVRGLDGLGRSLCANRAVSWYRIAPHRREI